MDTDEMIVHIRSITDKAIKLQDVIARAEQGKEFARQQWLLTKDMPNGVYWLGKWQAYTAITDVYNGTDDLMTLPSI